VEQKPDSGLVREAQAFAARAKAEMAKRIVGKDAVLRGILTGVIAGGHVLLEGVPGLAKTVAVKTLAEIAGLEFRRIQFTPDLLPSDITGSLVYEQASGRFTPRRGPIFANLVLADEVNRAPAKVQSALLEAMEEHQVTIGEESLALPEPFFVLATQNPIEHEGTYPLPEAQLDRFLLKVLASYPSEAEEGEIVRRVAASPQSRVDRVLGPREIAQMRAAAESVVLDEGLAAYLIRLVRATRPEGGRMPASPREAGSRAAAGGGRTAELARDVDRWVEYGASPRASIHLFRCARISAFLEGRAYVLPDDIKSMAPDVLRHRLVGEDEAEAEGIGADEVVARVLAATPLP
jgi:MoxR-like ATPase